MKRLLLLILFSTIILFSAKGQEVPAAFLTDLDSAKQVAIAKEVPILMVFAGSDWCRPCMQFKQQILSNEIFQSYADTELVILYLDFPAKKKNKLSTVQLKHNEALAERFNKSGAFPYIVLMNPQEELLATFAYRQQKAEAFVEEVDMLGGAD